MVKSLIVSIGPHIRSELSTKKIMWQAVLSLIPAGIAGIFIFGIKSFFIIVTAIVSALLTEAIILAMRRKEITIYDGSAILTGLLLAYSLPPKVPLWMPAVGSFFAISVGKHTFGGLGHNIFNPALVGRAFLLLSWPMYMTSWQNPRWKVDVITGATPLKLFKYKEFTLLKDIPYWDLFIGNRGGCIGEVCIIALLIGALYLLFKRFISWHIPIIYISTVGFLSWIFNGEAGLFRGDILFFILSGGLMLGAFFMATDYITSPLTQKGKIIFGIGLGILTFLIRKYSGYPEGVSYSILIMNAFVPLIDRYTRPKLFGYKKEKA